VRGVASAGVGLNPLIVAGDDPPLFLKSLFPLLFLLPLINLGSTRRVEKWSQSPFFPYAEGSCGQGFDPTVPLSFPESPLETGDFGAPTPSLSSDFSTDRAPLPPRTLGVICLVLSVWFFPPLDALHVRQGSFSPFLIVSLYSRSCPLSSDFFRVVYRFHLNSR